VTDETTSARKARECCESALSSGAPGSRPQATGSAVSKTKTAAAVADLDTPIDRPPQAVD
jgi:hypothetical protein